MIALTKKAWALGMAFLVFAFLSVPIVFGQEEKKPEKPPRSVVREKRDDSKVKERPPAARERPSKEREKPKPSDKKPSP